MLIRIKKISDFNGDILRKISIFAFMDNKTLIEQVAGDCGISREDTQDMLDAFYGIVAECCVAMDTIIIPGFGQFEPKSAKSGLPCIPPRGSACLCPRSLWSASGRRLL